MPAPSHVLTRAAFWLVTKSPQCPPKLHADEVPHTYTFEVEENIVADWKYTSSHYESHPRSLAQAPAHKPHPSRGLPLPNNPLSIFRLNFFGFFLTTQTPDQVFYPNLKMKNALEYPSPTVRGQPGSFAAIKLMREIQATSRHLTSTLVG